MAGGLIVSRAVMSASVRFPASKIPFEESAAAPAPAAASELLSAFQHHYDDLLRYLARRLGCNEEARDMVQELGVHVSQADPRTAPRNTRAYLFGMARNLAAEHLRRMQRQRQIIMAPQGDDLPEGCGEAGSDVLERHLHREALQATIRGLQALPARTQEVFLLHRAEGIGHDELAARYGVTRSTIEREVIRATDSVHRSLAHWRGDPPASTAARGRRRRSLQALLATLMLGVGAGGMAWHLRQEHRVVWHQGWHNARRREQAHDLPDGSQIVLDAGSAVEVDFEAARRHVRLLRGSAWFDVAHAQERPFVVDVADLRITVRGTRFAVESDPSSGAEGGIEVHVAEGRVAVAPGGWRAWFSTQPEVMLGAGDGLRVLPGQPWQDDPAPLGAVPEVAPWREGRIGFSHLPLQDAVNRLARYHAKPVRVTAAVAGLPVSGDLRLDRVEDWLRALPAALPVDVTESAAGFVIGARMQQSRPRS